MRISERLGGLLVLTVVTALGAALPACANGPAVGERLAQRPWLVTVYYTAVESYHHSPPVEVTGCPARPCSGAARTLGRYPAGFVEAVQAEGTGRITSGPHRGRYLNWSHDIGYWLDDAPRDANGRPLVPFRSAAADGIPDRTPVRMVNCGRLDSGAPVPGRVCRALRDADWEIRDQFTPGYGGNHHIDLYIGEESEVDFARSGWLYVTLTDVGLRLRT